MQIKAIDLYNILEDYSVDALKELDIVIELNRKKDNTIGDNGYATLIEEYPSQIRIIGVATEGVNRNDTIERI